ncbi:hypothetical protein FF38_03820, partial [Lucilia cuprina]
MKMDSKYFTKYSDSYLLPFVDLEKSQHSAQLYPACPNSAWLHPLWRILNCISIYYIKAIDFIKEAIQQSLKMFDSGTLKAAYDIVKYIGSDLLHPYNWQTPDEYIGLLAFIFCFLSVYVEGGEMDADIDKAMRFIYWRRKSYYLENQFSKLKVEYEKQTKKSCPYTMENGKVVPGD